MRTVRVLIYFALVFCCAIPAGAQSTGLKPEDVFQMEFAADPQISPDGRQIVYVRQFSDVMTDRNYSNLWIINTDGTGHRPLTTGSFSDTSPRWSPDGSRLLYTSNRAEGGKTQIYLRWMDSGQTSALTNIENAPTGIAWSPDGKQISFLSLVKGKAPSVITMPSPPSGAKWAEPAIVVDKLVYRFNGPGYLASGYVHLFVVPAEGGTARQLTSGNLHYGPATGGGGTSWTADGKFILLSANLREDWEYEPRDTEVYEISVADGKVRALTNRRGPDGGPVASPDGRFIAYSGFDDRYQGYQVARLSVMNRDGSNSHTLCADLDRDPTGVTWAGDNSGLYFAYDDKGNTKLGFCSLDGKPRTLAESMGSGGSSYSSGANFTLAKNGGIAFAHTTPLIPGDIAYLAPGAASPRVLTAVNDDLFAQRKLGATEEFWYEASNDKKKMQGWLVKPPDFDPAKKYPLFLEIHGGPFANYGDRFDVEKQIWAAMGYVVVYVNPRGSTSYGGDFGNLIHHAYPGDDFYDLNSGVDAVIAKGYIDAGRLYVGGGSGGGVLTAWMIGRSTRFRAAVSYYPVINWASWTLNSDIPITGAKYWFPGNPWDFPEQFWKRSLLSVVKNVKTPCMVITGEEDYRTPISESEQYYTALKLLKVDAVLVRVPGEPHGIRRRPSHWVSKILHISGWFERYK